MSRKANVLCIPPASATQASSRKAKQRTPSVIFFPSSEGNLYNDEPVQSFVGYNVAEYESALTRAVRATSSRLSDKSSIAENALGRLEEGTNECTVFSYVERRGKCKLKRRRGE